MRECGALRKSHPPVSPSPPLPPPPAKWISTHSVIPHWAISSSASLARLCLKVPIRAFLTRDAISCVRQRGAYDNNQLCTLLPRSYLPPVLSEIPPTRETDRRSISFALYPDFIREFLAVTSPFKLSVSFGARYKIVFVVVSARIFLRKLHEIAPHGSSMPPVAQISGARFLVYIRIYAHAGTRT